MPRTKKRWRTKNTEMGRTSDVPVRQTNYLGMPHGFLSMPRLCTAAPQAIAEIVHEVGAMRAALTADPQSLALNQLSLPNAR